MVRASVSDPVLQREFGKVEIIAGPGFLEEGFRMAKGVDGGEDKAARNGVFRGKGKGTGGKVAVTAVGSANNLSARAVEAVFRLQAPEKIQVRGE